MYINKTNDKIEKKLTLYSLYSTSRVDKIEAIMPPIVDGKINDDLLNFIDKIKPANERTSSPTLMPLNM